MRILVDDYGVFVGKKNKCFVIKIKTGLKSIKYILKYRKT